MISVLSIDSDAQFSLLLSIFMQAEGGFVLSTAREGNAGCDLLADVGFDVILLESELPGTSGFEILRSIRRSGDDTPVIMFTARGDNLDRYRAVQDQADMYLPKSCRLPELTDCIRRLHHAAGDPIKRQAPPTDAGTLALDKQRQRALYRGRSIPLSPSEYRVLATLAERDGKAVTRDILAAAAATGVQAAVDNCIGSLRRKLGPGPQGEQLIRAVSDRGYTLRL